MDTSEASKAGNPCAKHYQVSLGHAPYERRTRFLGELKGSWYDIGHQIGTNAGDLVRWVSDVWWTEHVQTYGFDDTMQAMSLYEAQVAALSSDLIRFMHGVADGAAEELEKSPYALASSHYHKVLNTNIFDAWSWRHPTHLPWKSAGKRSSDTSSGSFEPHRMLSSTSPLFFMFNSIFVLAKSQVVLGLLPTQVRLEPATRKETINSSRKR